MYPRLLQLTGLESVKGRRSGARLPADQSLVPGGRDLVRSSCGEGRGGGGSLLQAAACRGGQCFGVPEISHKGSLRTANAPVVREGAL
jgi:hypothetical protein